MQIMGQMYSLNTLIEHHWVMNKNIINLNHRSQYESTCQGYETLGCCNILITIWTHWVYLLTPLILNFDSSYLCIQNINLISFYHINNNFFGSVYTIHYNKHHF